jgi:hypothetical protein
MALRFFNHNLIFSPDIPGKDGVQRCFAGNRTANQPATLPCDDKICTKRLNGFDFFFTDRNGNSCDTEKDGFKRVLLLHLI